MKKQRRQAIRLPKCWKTRDRFAVLDVISLAKYSLIWAQDCAFNYHQKRAAHDLSLSLLERDAHQMLREEIPGPAQRPRIPPPIRQRHESVAFNKHF